MAGYVSGKRQVAESSERDNKISGPIQCGEFFSLAQEQKKGGIF